MEHLTAHPFVVGHVDVVSTRPDLAALAENLAELRAGAMLNPGLNHAAQVNLVRDVVLDVALAEVQVIAPELDRCQLERIRHILNLIEG